MVSNAPAFNPVWEALEAFEAPDPPAQKQKLNRKRPRAVPFQGVDRGTLPHDPRRNRPSSGFYGVSVDKKRWKAEICFDNKRYFLGNFDTKQEAALAYDRAGRQCGLDKPMSFESIRAAEEAAAQAQTEFLLIHPKQPKPRPKSGFYGVYADKKRWVARICYDSKQHQLGSFATKQEAALVYDRKARECVKDKLLNYESIQAAEEAAAQAEAGLTLCFLPTSSSRIPALRK
jgi:hypothetical protein